MLLEVVFNSVEAYLLKKNSKHFFYCKLKLQSVFFERAAFGNIFVLKFSFWHVLSGLDARNLKEE
jgi:hypothetical protein